MTRYIEERRDTFGVEPICRVLEVPVSTFYARRSRVPSARELADRELVERDPAARAGYRRAYGARKTWKELKRRDVEVGRDHVARLMRREGSSGTGAAPGHARRSRTRPPPSLRVTCCSATSPRPARTRSGSPTSPTSAPGTASSTSRSSSTVTAARSSAGRSRPTCAPSSSSTRSRWPTGCAGRPADLIVHTRPGPQPEFNLSSQHCRLTGRMVVPRPEVLHSIGVGGRASAIAEAA